MFIYFINIHKSKHINGARTGTILYKEFYIKFGLRGEPVSYTHLFLKEYGSKIEVRDVK